MGNLKIILIYLQFYCKEMIVINENIKPYYDRMRLYKPSGGETGVQSGKKPCATPSGKRAA